jgi:hypothetical protein
LIPEIKSAEGRSTHAVRVGCVESITSAHTDPKRNLAKKKRVKIDTHIIIPLLHLSVAASFDVADGEVNLSSGNVTSRSSSAVYIVVNYIFIQTTPFI